MRTERKGRVVEFFKVASDPSSTFAQACKAAGIQPTKRQASKWLNHKGLAWKHRGIQNQIKEV